MPWPSASGSPRAARHGGHHDGTESQQAGIVDRIRRILPVLTLALHGEVDHHDSIFLYDADQQDDSDDGDDVEVLPEEDERQQRTYTG